MQSEMYLVYQEEFPLDDRSPRMLRERVASFAPLLGDTTGVVQHAASELASALVRLREGAGTFEFRLLAGDEVFRVELEGSLVATGLLTAPEEDEGQIRLKLLDDLTDRWGVLGGDKSVLWFEVVRTRRTADEMADETGRGENRLGDDR